MVGKIGPGLRTSGFPRLKTSIGRRGFASKALDYSVPQGNFQFVKRRAAALGVATRASRGA
jgi:hypothetical protein